MVGASTTGVVAVGAAVVAATEGVVGCCVGAAAATGEAEAPSFFNISL